MVVCQFKKKNIFMIVITVMIGRAMAKYIVLRFYWYLVFVAISESRVPSCIFAPLN